MVMEDKESDDNVDEGDNLEEGELLNATLTMALTTTTRPRPTRFAETTSSNSGSL